MSCETVKIRLDDGLQDGNPEVTSVTDSGNFIKTFLIGLRLYLDGAYNDPPAEMLPPVPEVQGGDGCCTLL